MTPQIRAIANLTALAELLKPDPDPDVLAHYEGWADARVRNWVFDIIGVVKPEHHALFDRLASELNIHNEALLNAGALTAYFTPLPICESMWQITLNHPSVNVYVVTYYPTTSRYKPLLALS